MFDVSESQVFLRADLINILRGLARAGMGPVNRGVTLRDADYRDGYMAAIEAMAATLGVPIGGGQGAQEMRVRTRYR